MSRPFRPENLAAMTVACPRCGSPPGKPCRAMVRPRNPTSEPWRLVPTYSVSPPHRGRFRAAGLNRDGTPLERQRFWCHDCDAEVTTRHHALRGEAGHEPEPIHGGSD